MKAIDPVPEGFHTVTPHMVIKGAAEAIDFYKKAYGADEPGRHLAPDGSLIMHATLRIGNSLLMLSDEFPSQEGCEGWVSPETASGTAVALHVYTGLQGKNAAYGCVLGGPIRAALGSLRSLLEPGVTGQGNDA